MTGRTIVVTPFASSEQLTAACVLASVHGIVVPTGNFTALVVPEGSAGVEAATAVSRLAGKNDVLLMINSGEHIEASQWRKGQRLAEVPAGLAMTNLPDEVERLVLGVDEPTDIPGHKVTSEMSKLQASAASMTPERAALARTALVWIVAGFIALVVAIAAGVVALAGNALAWAAFGLGWLVFAVSVWRIVALLGLRRRQGSRA